MATTTTGTLTSNTGTFIFDEDQKNSIVLSTANKFVDSNISLMTKVTKAVLNTTTSDVDHKSFDIQIPNGNSTSITLNFAVDANGNVIVT